MSTTNWFENLFGKSQEKLGKQRRRGQKSLRGGTGTDGNPVLRDFPTVNSQDFEKLDNGEQVYTEEKNVRLGNAGRGNSVQPGNAEEPYNPEHNNNNNVFGGKKVSKTNQRVSIGGKERVVYEGVRGGKYIKKGGELVSLSKILRNS